MALFYDDIMKEQHPPLREMYLRGLSSRWICCLCGLQEVWHLKIAAWVGMYGCGTCGQHTMRPWYRELPAVSK
jgi:hypothetical protein